MNKKTLTKEFSEYKDSPEGDELMVTIQVEHYGTTAAIYISGEFYLDSIEYAERIWNQEVALHPQVIGICCKNVKYIDSSAIGILVKFLNNAKKMGIELVFFDLSESVLSVFATARLNDFFVTMTDEMFRTRYNAHVPDSGTK